MNKRSWPNNFLINFFIFIFYPSQSIFQFIKSCARMTSRSNFFFYLCLFDNICQIYLSLDIIKTMASDIEEDLMHMLETLIVNTGIDYEIENLDILLQQEFYFEICERIFPQQNITLLKIAEDPELDQVQKMNKLLSLLNKQLQIDFSEISGEEILKGHLIHMHKLMRILQKCSEYSPFSPQDGPVTSHKRHKSDPNTSSRLGEVHQPRSARVKAVQPEDEEQSKTQTIPSSKPREQSLKDKIPKKNKKFSYSVDKKKKRSQKQARKNVFGSVLNIMINEKNRATTASIRDNRKKKNEQITQAKTKYKSYLVNHKKQIRAAKNRKNLQKLAKFPSRQLPLEDFANINNFFQSFAYKFRDLKYCYLKNIKKKIHSQQIDRMTYNNRIRRQMQKQNEKKTKVLLQRVNNEHKTRTDLHKERFEASKQSSRLQKKEYERYLRQQKKQLKESKKQEKKKIQEFIDQENRKVLMNFEEDGKLERVILDMYKRF